MVVDDVDKSAEFYKNILNLEEISHPDKKPGFRWFTIKGSSQLHLIQKEFVSFEKNESMHLCLATKKSRKCYRAFEKKRHRFLRLARERKCGHATNRWCQANIPTRS